MQGLNHVHSAKSRRFSRWQLVAASDSLAHVIEVSLFVFLCGFYVVFLSFFFFSFWRACFRALQERQGAFETTCHWYEVSDWLRKCTCESYFLRVVVVFAVHAWKIHVTWFRPAGHGGMKPPLKLSLHPHDDARENSCCLLLFCTLPNNLFSHFSHSI